MEAEQPNTRPSDLTYAQAGVDTSLAQEGLKGLLGWVEKTKTFREVAGAPALDIGYFANVLDIGHGMGLAISTDGVGSKLLIAQQAGRYESVGVDCVAVNVNDVLCVGAEPIALVDCITLEWPDPSLLEELGKGLYRGAELARIAIVGGEMAQVPDMLKGPRPGHAFDLVGTCVGLVPLDRVIVGQDIQDGDVVVGLASSGIHSNGLTLARKALLDSGLFTLETYVPELGKTLGEELLEPTHIYVLEVLEMLSANLRVKALAHISGDGLLNLTRVRAPVGYVIEQLPDRPPVLPLIQKAGQVSDEEMFAVFNMGIGFCVVVDPADASQVIEIAARHGGRAYQIGYALPDPERRVRVEPYNLVGARGRFQRIEGHTP